MKKVLIIGSSPLPDENSKSRPAAGLRTWQFFHGLKGAMGEGYDIHLAKIAMPECYDTMPENGYSKSDPRLTEKIQKLHDDFKPDVVIGVNTFPSYIAAGLKSEASFWADLNGWIMAEGQAQAYKTDSNDYLGHYHEMEGRVIKKADKFSVVSGAQKYALIGELACIGRLNKETFDFELVSAVANGTEWFEGEREAAEMTVESALRGLPPVLSDLPGDAVKAVWVGGYNTWVDEEVLFHALDKAMADNQNLYFVSTGGEIAGLDNKTFSRFKELVENSKFKERFVFLGWLKTEQMPLLYKVADFGLNVDRMCVETATGARNRINEMMKFGLPVISTLGSEIAHEMQKAGAGVAVKSGDVEALTAAILGMCAERNFYGDKGSLYIEEHCNYAVTLKPVIEWLKSGAPVAPDRNVAVNFGKVGRLKAGIRYLRENGIKKFLKKMWQRVRIG